MRIEIMENTSYLPSSMLLSTYPTNERINSDLGSLPDNLSDLPDNLSGLPDNLSGLPDNLSGLPDNLSGLPDNLGGLPGNLGDISDKLNRLYDSLVDLNEKEMQEIYLICDISNLRNDDRVCFQSFIE